MAYINIPFKTRAKLKPTGYKIILIGYLLTLRQYKLYNLVIKLFLVSLSLRIKEDKFQDQLDKLKELGENLDSFNLMELVKLDLNKLLGLVMDCEGIGP